LKGEGIFQTANHPSAIARDEWCNPLGGAIIRWGVSR
jgi:hypothetical protein